MVPMDQPTGAKPPWLTCKASLSQLATWFGTSGGLISSIVGTANEIAVSTTMGVATLSFPAGGINIYAAAANGGALFQGYNSTGSTRTGYLDFVSGTGGGGGATETVLENDGSTANDWLSLAAGGVRRLQINGLGNITANAPSSGATLTLNATGVGEIINTSPNNFGIEVLSNHSVGASFGYYGQAGTNNTDFAAYFVNAAGTVVYAQLVGDGGLVLGNISAAHSNGNGTIVVQPTAATDAIFVSGSAGVTGFFVNGALGNGAAGYNASNTSGAAFYNSNTLNAALVMNSAGTDYGVIGNTTTQVWGLGYTNNVGPLGSWALQWGTNGGEVMIGPAAWASSAFAGPSRATLHLNGTTDNLIDFSVNGTNEAYIYGITGELRLLAINPGVITFYPNSVLQWTMGSGLYANALTAEGNGTINAVGYYLNNVNQLYQNTFTATFACGGANPTGTAHYSVAGDSVTITWPAVLGAGSAGSTTLSISGIPAAIQPARAQFVPLGSSVVENGGVIPAGGGCFDMLFNASSGTVNIYQAGSAAAFAGATNRGFANAVSTTYQLS
jgi:hypothetical protein